MWLSRLSVFVVVSGEEVFGMGRVYFQLARGSLGGASKEEEGMVIESATA